MSLRYCNVSVFLHRSFNKLWEICNVPTKKELLLLVEWLVTSRRKATPPTPPSANSNSLLYITYIFQRPSRIHIAGYFLCSMSWYPLIAWLKTLTIISCAVFFSRKLKFVRYLRWFWYISQGDDIERESGKISAKDSSRNTWKAALL